MKTSLRWIRYTKREFSSRMYSKHFAKDSKIFYHLKGYLVSIPSLRVCLSVCLCVCVFSEVSEMVMPLTPLQGRLNSWYWLANIYHRGFKLFNSISTEDCRRRGRKSPGSMLRTHKHTRVHKPDTLTAHWASYSPVISTQSDFNPSPAYRDKCSQHNKGCVCVCFCVRVCAFCLCLMCSSLNVCHTGETKWHFHLH